MAEQVSFGDKVRQLSRELQEPEWLTDMRLRCCKDFEELEKPDFKYGMSLFMPVRGAKLEEVNPLDGLKNDVEIQAPEGASVMKVSEALQDEDLREAVKKYFLKKAYYPGENKITAMHGAFWSQGIIIYIPEGERLQEEIRIRTNMKAETSITHTLIVAEPNSKAHVVSVAESEDLDYGLKSEGVEALVMEGSHVTYESLQDLNENVWHFSTKRAVVGKEARMDWFTGTFGSRHSKVEVSTDLAGQGANADNLGVFMAGGFQEFDTYNTAVHSAPHTESDMDNKGVVLDRSQSVYRGLIKVKENAPHSNGYQKEDTLILSDHAEADAVPNLELDNNEVRCSHGATVGQIDDEKIFYLMSRGLTRKEAKREIVKGFLGSMVNKVKNEELEKRMEELVLERMA